ncbi:HemK2/MTQ2 family protein methyltransferase [Actinomadura sp. NTSP31]|uniref:HemK2/MTQ2 family protein methyltransferase n=1 Tax=Actinomadura sp. NTSP31 TaxID=1735447 RepID=UPI0035BF713C
MVLLRPPGVYRPQGDTRLLTDVLRRLPETPGARVLELGTGTGAVAMAAARAGASRVVAVDVSARAVLAARLNARLRGLPVRAVRGDLFKPVAGERFDLVIANPPYVCGTDPAAARGSARAWEAGPDGRALLNRICTEAPGHLAPGGTLLVLHSALNGIAATFDLLERAGMRASVVARRQEPFGPVMLGRAAELESRGLVRAGQRHEELVVIRADLAGADERPGDVSQVA